MRIRLKLAAFYMQCQKYVEMSDIDVIYDNNNNNNNNNNNSRYNINHKYFIFTYIYSCPCCHPCMYIKWSLANCKQRRISDLRIAVNTL